MCAAKSTKKKWSNVDSMRKRRRTNDKRRFKKEKQPDCELEEKIEELGKLLPPSMFSDEDPSQVEIIHKAADFLRFLIGNAPLLEGRGMVTDEFES